MHRIRTSVLAIILLIALHAAAAPQGALLPLPEDRPAIGINTPAISPDGKTVCFSYLGDLWTVPATGGLAARLTVHEAHDGWPRWSPDGKWIAFASNREGTYDVYVVPSTGGEARRLTWHPANDYPTDWTPDGTKIITYSMRGTEGWRICSVDVKTLAVRTLTEDTFMNRFASMSPDGASIAYNRSGSIGVWWRPRYHGSASMRVYVKSLKTGKSVRITDYDGQSTWPMYSGDGKRILCASDCLTPGAPNIVSMPAAGGKPALITHFHDDAVRWPSIARDGSTVVFVRGGELYTVPAAGGEPSRLSITVRSDDKQNNTQRLTLTSGASEVEIAPDGKTLALVVRGDIWTIPVAGGDAKRLVSSAGNDYDIAWSPDSGRIVYVSDRAGNFDIYSIDVKSREDRTLSADPNDESSPAVSPDGKSVSFLRSGPAGGLYVVASDGKSLPRRVVESQGNNLFGVGITSSAWSPDSKWMAFTRRDPRNAEDLWVIPVAGGPAVNVTYYPGDNGPARWSSDGKYLVFASDRDRVGSGADLYCIPLQKEKAEAEDKPADEKKPDQPKPDAARPAEPRKPVEVKIDFDDIENRAKRITTQGISTFEMMPDGKAVVFVSASGGPPEYWRVPVNGGSVTRLTTGGDGAGTPRFASDAGRFWALGSGGSVRSITLGGPAAQVAPVAFTARLELDRRAEVKQAFSEFWRRMNVGFYDPKMHGVDWKAVRARYEPLLQGVATREEFAMFLLSMMVGELNSSHSEVSPGGGSSAPELAELGLTFDEEYAGPGLKVTGYLERGPDDDQGPRIKAGEYVVQIDGEAVSWTDTAWKTLFDKVGKTVELSVNTKPVMEGARTVKLKPIGSGEWRRLTYENHVRTARRSVEKLSGGKLAYVHIKGMDGASMTRMERELWGKAQDAEGLVLDVRGNGGGNTHDTILNQLSRVAYAYTVPRDGARSTQPFRHWSKPIVLLIDESSASDAEIFPAGFRALKLGKIVGMPTPGYVIGTYGGTLADGTSYRIPMWGWYTLDGRNLENLGASPDVEVENTLEDIAAHRDRQLETAVSLLLKELPGKR